MPARPRGAGEFTVPELCDIGAVGLQGVPPALVPIEIVIRFTG